MKNIAKIIGSGLLLASVSTVQADIVHNDDVIIDGSACVGFDCVNGESFGFDTIRIKENNLRIKADDTSTTASFPQRDWQLTFNDSANGGQEKFSIDDVTGGRTPFTIEGNSPSNSLYVDDGGRIGLGTSTPVVELHVVDGDTPTLRLEQDGSSGFTPQTWDVAGNETNFFVRDATNGSTLPFRIRPGAPSSSIFVDTDGDVGIGTSSPDSDIDVESSGTFTTFRLTAAGATHKSAVMTYTEGGAATGSFRVNIDDTDAQEFAVNSSGNIIIAGTCIQIGADACTVVAGALSCTVANCP